MNQWENLIQAGMIKKIGDLYTVDTRGIVLASTYEWYTKNTWNAIDMLRDLDSTDNITEYLKILAKIQSIPQPEIVKATKEIKARADESIEAQKDLAVLDTF
jgi:Ni,Fe-hydrogenase maturation factor